MNFVPDDNLLRSSMFDHLDRLRRESPDECLPSSAINTFRFNSVALRLIVQSGIWKPAMLTAALTIRTTFTPPNQPPPYADLLGDDGLIRYKYRGTDPNHADNRALREAMVRRLPLAYFVGIRRGEYFAQYPVWIHAEDPTHYEFAIVVDEAQRVPDASDPDDGRRAYIERLTRARLHQPLFRARVLRAYPDRSRCVGSTTQNFSTLRTSFPTASPWVRLSCQTGFRCAKSIMLRTT